MQYWHHSLLPTSRHETAVSIKKLQIWNQYHLLPLSTSNLDWNLRVFTETLCCTMFFFAEQAMLLEMLLLHKYLHSVHLVQLTYMSGDWFWNFWVGRHGRGDQVYQMIHISMLNARYDWISCVILRYKYVLIKVTATKDSTEISKNIVRGYSWAEYHGEWECEEDSEYVNDHASLQCMNLEIPRHIVDDSICNIY